MLKRILHVTALFLFFAVRIVFGQAGTADLTGIVSDSAGALLAAAKVTATDTQTGVGVGASAF